MLAGERRAAVAVHRGSGGPLQRSTASPSLAFTGAMSGQGADAFRAWISGLAEQALARGISPAGLDRIAASFQTAIDLEVRFEAPHE